MIATAELVPEVIETDECELLTEFAAVMLEWGHYKTAACLRFPELYEASRVAAGRKTGLSRNRRPDGTWIPIP